MSYNLFLANHFSNSKISNFKIFPSLLENVLGYFTDGDSYNLSSKRFCVIDGVTRDLKNGNEFKITNKPLELLETICYYPDMVKLRRIASILSRKFIESKSEDILFIMEEINDILSSFNDFSCDYLGKDSFTYTMAGGIIEEDHIDIANIGDSNVFLFDSNFDLIFSTYDSFTERNADRNKYFSDVIGKDLIGGWENNELRERFRSKFRNTHLEKIRPFSFGALNGEESSMDYVYRYSHSLSDVCYIVAFTDGYLDIINIRSELIKLLTNQSIRPEKEGTVVVYKRR